MKVAIAIPENRDVILKGMFWGFLRFISSLKENVVIIGNDGDEMVPGKTSYIDNMRNRLVERARELECTHILFLDSDTIPPPGALGKLLQAKKDIIGGVYRFRVPPYRVLAFWYAVNRYLPLSDLFENKIMPVEAVGMGCTLINMSVFEKLERPYFYNGYVDFNSPYAKDDSAFDGKRYIGEDVYFCEKAAMAGFEIFLHTGVQSDHITQVYIPGNLKTPEQSIVSDHQESNFIKFGGTE